MSTPQANTKNTKNIVLAKHAGFCYGVKRAVETTKQLKKQFPEKDVFVLGELIHNSLVIQELENLNIKKIDAVSDCVSSSGVCVIRSHGVPAKIYQELEAKGVEIADLTCPDVKKVQKKAYELAADGYLLIIIGKPEHPEVVAIKANAQEYSQNVYVAPDVEALKKIEKTIKEYKKIGVVVQTTQRVSVLQEVVNYLLPLVQELKICNTICASTSLRQNEARELATKSDLMIVVGSKKSANTSHLAEILKDITSTIHIEKVDDLADYSDLIQKSQNIGITAGASTPDYLINEVLNKLKQY